MNLIFLGPPGAGKGTIAAQLKESLSIPHISTGDLFRSAIKNQTEWGQKVKAIMEKGDLVPDEMTTGMVKERLSEADASSGYILDGYPRTIGQAEALNDFATIDRVVSFIVSDESIIRRLSGRRLCRQCGKSYHIEYVKPAVEGKCDDCGGELYTRDDDKIEAIKNRLAVYESSTRPLIEYYTKKGLLQEIDGSLSPGEVAANTEKVLRQ